jgi:CubicO group peptidase (beta-lactamase class C family)
MKNFIIALSIALFLAIGTIAAQQAKDASLKQGENSKSSGFESKKIVRSQVSKEIDNYLNRTVPFGFSGAIIVAKNDEIILQNGYGLSNRERRIPVTVDTVFYIGSVTKQFTAAAVLKLEMQGKLRVTDTLDKIFKDVPPDKAGITIHQLLTHSSGLGGAEDIYGSPVQKDDQVRRVMAMKLRSEPGKEYFYSNPGYNLLGIIVENVSGQTYEKYLHENLFKPAGMLKTGYRIPAWEKDKVAHGYSDGVDKGSPLDRPWFEDGPSWALRGAGGMLSTLGDLYRWHLALKKDEILSAEAKSKIFSPHVKMEDNMFYGYGWSLQKTPRGTNLIEHNGGDGIFFADFRRYVDENVVVIGFANDVYGVGLIESKVPDILFRSANIKFPPQAREKNISSTVLQKYLGMYQLPSGAILNVTQKRNRLIVDPIGQEAVNLLTNIQPPETVAFEKLNVKIKGVLDEAIKGDFTKLQGAVVPERFEVFKSFLSEVLKSSEVNNPSPVKYEVIGSHPLWFVKDRPLTTFVRLTDDKGSARLILITWENDRIRGRGVTRENDDVTFRTPLVSNSKKSFVGFHPGLEKPLNISFKTNRNGEAVAIEVQTDEGVRTAKRVDAP